MPLGTIEPRISLYGLDYEDKLLINEWIKYQLKWNNEYWQPDPIARKAYEQALTHLKYTLNDRNEQI